MAHRVQTLDHYPAIAAMLEELARRVVVVLGRELVGVYVHGSLAYGGFRPGRSDVDFLAVTQRDLSEGMVRSLAVMHAAFRRAGHAGAERLEGSYIPRAALRRYDPTRAWHPALRMDGAFAIDHHTSDWVIQRHLLRCHGVPMLGPPLAPLIDPVSPRELQSAARAVLLEWWRPMLDDPWRLRDREYQAYAVLTMCRALYTIERGEVATKAESARWAMGVLDPGYRSLIERALAYPDGPQPDELEGTRSLIAHVLERVFA